MSNSFQHENAEELTFGDHLDVFRKHLMRAIIVTVIVSIAVFYFKEFLFDTLILGPQSPDFWGNKLFCKLATLFNADGICNSTANYKLINIEITGQFMLHFNISIALGFILSFPYILWEFWRFIKPALSKKERSSSRGLVFYSSMLFVIGVLFGYYIISPLTLNFFSSYTVSNSLENQFLIQSYISTITTSCVSTGVSFELPIIIYFLSKIGLMTPYFLKKYRRHAIVILFIIAGLLTPADPISIFLVAIPLLFLYELSILISKRVYRKKNV